MCDCYYRCLVTQMKYYINGSEVENKKFLYVVTFWSTDVCLDLFSIFVLHTEGHSY